MTDLDLKDAKSVCPKEMTQIKLVPTWPEPKIKAHGIVLTKDGLIKEDKNGDYIDKCGSISGG